MAALFRRRPKLPADRRPRLEPDERVVAWAVAHPVIEAPEAGTVVATTRGLWLPGGRSRLGWYEVHKAVWSGRVLTVTPAGRAEEHPGYAVMADLPDVAYLLLEPGDVPHQVRTRVTASVAYSRHHPVPGGGVRVVARRVSGVDGLTWTVRYDPGTDSADLRPTVDQLVAQARAEMAPPP